MAWPAFLGHDKCEVTDTNSRKEKQLTKEISFLALFHDALKNVDGDEGTGISEEPVTMATVIETATVS